MMKNDEMIPSLKKVHRDINSSFDSRLIQAGILFVLNSSTDFNLLVIMIETR